ncbi:unnamed protein product, partial [Ascophyllum nodosum]
GLVKQLYPDDPRAGTFTPSWRFMGKWAKKWSVATRRRSNSKNQSIEERLPRSSASTSRCGHSCRTRHRSLVGRTGQ